MLTGDTIRIARENAEWHCSQIQGFHYKAQTSDKHQHVVRDLTKPAGHDWLWSKDGSPSEYDATHEAMMTEIERVRDGILAFEINSILEAGK